jgi:hypothetical protein
VVRVERTRYNFRADVYTLEVQCDCCKNLYPIILPGDRLAILMYEDTSMMDIIYDYPQNQKDLLVSGRCEKCCKKYHISNNDDRELAFLLLDKL